MNANKDFKFLYEIEKPIFGYEFGLCILKKIGGRFSLESGVRYSKMGFSQGKVNILDGSEEREFTLIHRFDFVNVPLKVQMNFISNSLITPIAKVGINNNIFINEFVNDFEGNWHENKAFNNRKYQPAISIGMGILVPIGDRFKGTLLPNLNHSLVSIDKTNPPIKRHLYSISVEMMVSYNLGKVDDK